MTKGAVIRTGMDQVSGSSGNAGIGGAPSLPVRPDSSINSSLFGLLIFLGTEVMFFAGLISAFLILRAGNPVWPPVGQPRLPVTITGINTLFLLFSGYAVHLARSAIRRDNLKGLNIWLSITGVLGAIFLGVQGFEWVRLVKYGLTMSSSLYGGTFYTLIGCHALHVLVAVIALLVTLLRALKGHYSKNNHTGVELCRVYWFFVVGIWPVLYALVYLS